MKASSRYRSRALATAVDREGAPRRLRILLITQSFHPDFAAVGQHATDLARHLAQRGHEVTVITSRSTYGIKGAALAPEEIVDGVHVLRVGRSLFGKADITRRSADAALFIAAAACRALMLPRQDVVVTSTLPPFAQVIGALVKLVRGSAHACWILDLHPDLAISVGALRERSIAARALFWFSGILFRHADLRAVMGRCMRERLVRHGVQAETIEILSPWADPCEIKPISPEDSSLRDVWELKGRFVVQYAGNFGLAHDIEILLDAAHLLAADPRFLFLFVGGGKQEVTIRSRVARGLPNVQVRPYVPREQLGESLAVGNVHLIALSRAALGVSVPSKFWGVLAASRPAVFVGPEECEIALIVRQERCGLVVQPEDANSLAVAIRRLADDSAERFAMGSRGRTALSERMSRQVVCDCWERRLLQISLLAKGASPRP